RGTKHPLRSVLVVTEIAGAMILVVGAALMIESFDALQRVNLGFRSNQLLTLRVPLSEGAYSKYAQRVSFAERVLEKVRIIPGVTSAGYTSALPLVWKGGTSGFFPEGTDRRDPSLAYDANNRVITPGFMETMGMTLVNGRAFTASDAATAPLVVIINETMARQ